MNLQPKIELKYEKLFYEFNVNDFSIKNIEGITKINSKLELAI